MTSPSENEREKILNKIYNLKEEIWETRAYISSDFCKQCSEMYTKIAVLEQQLRLLEKKLANYDSQN